MAKNFSISHKTSTVPGKAPLPADLARGELAVNLPDRKLFTKDQSDAVVELGASARRQRIWRSAVTGVVQPGEVRANNANISQATEILLSTLQPDGRQLAAELTWCSPGDRLFVMGAPDTFIFTIEDVTVDGSDTFNGRSAVTNHVLYKVQPESGLPMDAKFVDGQILDVAVWPMVPNATTAKEGAVRLANAAAITAGFAERVVDAAQLKAALASVTGLLIADTPPPVEDKKFWWDSSSGQLHVGYKDANSTQWVGCGGPPGKDGTGVEIAATAPATPGVGDLWVDISTAAKPVLKSWDGTVWSEVAPRSTFEVVSSMGAKYLFDTASDASGFMGAAPSAGHFKFDSTTVQQIKSISVSKVDSSGNSTDILFKQVAAGDCIWIKALDTPESLRFMCTVNQFSMVPGQRNFPVKLDKDGFGTINIDWLIDKPVIIGHTPAVTDLAVHTDPTGITGATKVVNMVKLTKAAYDALASKQATTVYWIVG